MTISRRDFIKASAITGALFPFAPVSGRSVNKTKGETKPVQTRIHFFTKDLDKYETEFMAETLAIVGVDGLDLTVRRGGKVDPEKVTVELPEVIEIAKKYNLAVSMISTGITSAEDKRTEEIIKTASALGVEHYRLGYYDYNMSAGILGSIDSIKLKLKDLSAMNRHYGIQAGYQNHSGGRVGSAGWDIWELIKDFPVETISSQFDIRHATVGGYISWVFILQLLQNNIGALALKDFKWINEKGRTRILNVPLGEGVVDFDRFFTMIKELEIEVPVTLHVEYPLLDSAEEEYTLLQKQRIIASKISKDLDFIKSNIST